MMGIRGERGNEITYMPKEYKPDIWNILARIADRFTLSQPRVLSSVKSLEPHKIGVIPISFVGSFWTKPIRYSQKISGRLPSKYLIWYRTGREKLHVCRQDRRFYSELFTPTSPIFSLYNLWREEQQTLSPFRFKTHCNWVTERE